MQHGGVGRRTGQSEKFWAVEHEFEAPVQTTEQQAEEQYVQTTIVGADGRFIVRLTFKPHQESGLGNSYRMAYHRMVGLERRFAKDPALKEAYKACIEDDIAKEYLRRCSASELHYKDQAYFMPHHAVVKASSTTTKLRVVYDASAKTSSGTSLNDQLLIGPTVQRSIFEILLGWREHKVVIMADVHNMYKQIWVHENDTRFQRILWREAPDEPMRQYASTTVTFGMAGAPFQATRTWKQIAENEQHTYPRASEALNNDCYVDDVLTGAADDEAAVKLEDQLNAALSKHGLKLMKWASNRHAFTHSAGRASRHVKHM